MVATQICVVYQTRWLDMRILHLIYNMVFVKKTYNMVGNTQLQNFTEGRSRVFFILPPR